MRTRSEHFPCFSKAQTISFFSIKSDHFPNKMQPWHHHCVFVLSLVQYNQTRSRHVFNDQNTIKYESNKLIRSFTRVKRLYRGHFSLLLLACWTAVHWCISRGAVLVHFPDKTEHSNDCNNDDEKPSNDGRDQHCHVVSECGETFLGMRTGVGL